MNRNERKQAGGRKSSDKKKKHKKSNSDQLKRLTAKQLQTAVLKVFEEQPKKRFNPRQILKRLHVANNKDSVQHALEQLVEQSKLQALEDFKFKLVRGGGPVRHKKVYEGFVDVTRTGSAYIECEDLEDDVFVAAKNLGSALHGDRVEIMMWWPRGRRRPEGEVIKVLERVTDRFVGTFFLRGERALVVPTREDVSFDIQVDLEDVKGAKEGEKVVVKILDWGSNRRPVSGVVTAVLGMEGNDLEMNTILINAGFDLSFPEEVLVESESLPLEISQSEISKRKDFRNVTTFTIDPEDAKDFDDALSVRFLEDESVEVGIHIADVTHYVRPGTALEKEAFKRSTSVYLVDRVIPMLPERLSNNLCSLRPHEDKLTFSAVFHFDRSGKILGEWFGKTMIHSDHRFSYEAAQVVIEEGEGAFFKELKYLNGQAKKIRKKRFQDGAIDFNVEEVRFRLDENGVPVEVFIKDRKDAHMLIEEFMLLANRRVATYIHKKGKGKEIPFVYRIHDYPNAEKVAELARFAEEMGYKMKVNTPKEIADSFNKLISETEKNPALKLLEPLAIRTMAKAEYSSNNIGHYGLAFEHYTHFTSPIRRFADVLVHRILFENLGADSFRVDKEILEGQCKHISLQERKAMDAERQSIKYKQVEFIKKHIGEVFSGFISGIIDRGFFVELETNKCEGMVPFDSLPEPFEVEEGRLKAIGMRSGRTLKMGDKVSVAIFNADLEKRQIDLRLEEEEYPDFKHFGRMAKRAKGGSSNRRRQKR